MLVFASLALGDATALAQGDAPPVGPVRLFIDCNNTPCDSDFFRTEITFVEHVRDRQTADVHLLMTGQSTGSGGREITFSFFGQGRFKGRDQVLKETFVVASSDDAVRRGMVRVMSLGLVPYVLGGPGTDRLRVTVQPAQADTTAAATASLDPWDRWSFRVNLNGNANGESSSQSFNINTNVTANRVTEESKVNLNARMNYRESKFDLPDGRTFLSPNRDYGAGGTYVKSLSGHWSAGARGNWNSSTFSNQNWSWSGGPAIEWDLFPSLGIDAPPADVQLLGERADLGLPRGHHFRKAARDAPRPVARDDDVDPAAVGNPRLDRGGGIVHTGRRPEPRERVGRCVAESIPRPVAEPECERRVDSRPESRCRPKKPRARRCS